MRLQRIILAFLLLVVTISLPYGARGAGSAVQEFLEREGKGWRFHLFGDGRVRSMYGPGTKQVAANEEGARRFLSDHSELFGIRDVSQLHLTDVEQEGSAKSFQFEQRLRGIPVIGGQLSVHTDDMGRVIAVSGQYHSLDRLEGGSIKDRSEARRSASKWRLADGDVSDGTLLILAGLEKPKLAWRFSTISRRTPGQWAVYVDALSPRKVLRVHPEFLEESGSGTVYRENSVVTPELTAEEFRKLKDAGRLSGKYTRTYNGNYQLWFRFTDLDSFTTAEESDRDYTFAVTDPKFTEAMAYYHINLAHDRWRSFGLKKVNRQIPVYVNVVTPDGTGYDNAFYTTGSFQQLKNGAIVMGAGNRRYNFGLDGASGGIEPHRFLI